MKKILIFTGAGASALSGIKTYTSSGPESLWNNHKISEICTFSTFYENYDKVHAFYDDFRSSLANLSPSSAHLFVADLQKEYGSDRVINITQNIDDFFERAGCKNTIHVHGSVREVKCLDCGHVEDLKYDNHNEACSKCGKIGKLKPNITFYYLGDQWSCFPN